MKLVEKIQTLKEKISELKKEKAAEQKKHAE
jgi:hypothetical protein